MSVEDRIRYLLRAALRAEREGSERAARSLRRMAEDARPLEGEAALLSMDSHLMALGE
ncbi:MAG TPA: hypothetical protein VLA43_18480 [Longimicrobiales bacterium]|nr:hypothetical protein [Longimicrobiales bacterium]